MTARNQLPILRAQRVIDLPLREVSGICLRRGRQREMWLIAVGDRAAKVASLSLPSADSWAPGWQITNVSKFPGSNIPKDDPQIEAICADGTGRILLLQEEPPRVELLDLELSRAVASIELVVERPGKLARSWVEPKGSRGEGAVLLPGGHLLVAKEKEPAALIEFGPPNSQPRGLARGGGLRAGVRWPTTNACDRFIALAAWFPDKALAKTCADFSDLEIGPDGRLYLLSDKSATIARLGDLRTSSSTASHTAAWRLEDIDGKPEGLTFLPDGRAVVALDKRKQRRNLALLEPAIAPP